MKTRVLNNRRSSLLLLCALVASYSFICLTKNCFSSAMVFIVDEGLLNKFQTGLITAIFYVVYALLQVLGGAVMDKFHPERFITFGLVGAGLCNLVIFFNQNYIVMLVSWAVNAAVQFGVWPATFKLISTMTTEDMRDNALFIVTFSNPVGVVVGYVVAAIVGSFWQMNFLFSAIGLICVAICWEIVFRSLKPHIVEEELTGNYEPTVKLKDDFNFTKIAFSSGLIMFIVISFVRCMFDLGIKALTPTMIYDCYAEVTPNLATVLNIIVLIAGASGPLLAHVLYPKYIRNEAIALTIVFSIALPLSIACLLIGSVSYWVIVILISLIIMLMGGGTLFTTSFIAARYNCYGKGATVAGILNCFASLGVVAANTIYTSLADSIGWHGTIAVWIALMAVALILSILSIPVWGKFLKSR